MRSVCTATPTSDRALVFWRSRTTFLMQSSVMTGIFTHLPSPKDTPLETAWSGPSASLSFRTACGPTTQSSKVPSYLHDQPAYKKINAPRAIAADNRLPHYANPHQRDRHTTPHFQIIPPPPRIIKVTIMHPNGLTPRPAAISVQAWNWIGAVMIVGIMIALYGPALRGGFIWDDIDNISQSPNMKDLAGLWRIVFTVDSTLQYYPLTFSAFWLQYRFFGDNPTGYHVMSLLAHIGASLLTWNILVQMRVDRLVAWGIAALFAWHPAHAESVAWITEFKNTFMGLLSAASVASYMRFDRSAFLDDNASPTVAGVTSVRRWGWYALSLLLFAMAMLAKTAAVPLPAGLLVLIWWKRGRFTWHDTAPIIPFFGVCIPLAGLTIFVERYVIATQWVPDRPTLFERVFIIARTFWFYIWKDLYPYGYTFVYPPWSVDYRAPEWVGFLIGMVVLFAVLWALRGRIGRGLLAGVLFYALLLSPTMGLVDIYFHRYSYVSDHFQYQASLGIFAIMAYAAEWIGRRLRSFSPTLGAAPMVLMVAFYAAHTPRQAAFFRDEPTLWRASLAVNENAWLCHSSIGIELINKGDYERAEASFLRALEIYRKAPEVYHNLGVMRVRQNRIPEAIVFFQQAIAVLETAYDSHFSLGMIYSRFARHDDALRALTRAAELRPNDDRIQLALARQMIEMDRNQEGMRILRDLIDRNPNLAQAHYLLAVAYRQLGLYKESAAEYERVLRFTPEVADVENELGELLRQIGQEQQARKHFREAIRIDPNHAKAHKNLESR